MGAGDRPGQAPVDSAGDELDRLLRAVERIADGCDGIRELAVTLSTARPGPAPSRLDPSERAAVSELEEAIGRAIAGGAKGIQLSLGDAARVYLLVSEAAARR